MPRRLRVAFAAQQFLTLPCASGTFTRTGRSATLSYVPNHVIEDAWELISNPAYVYGDNRAGPRLEQGWWRGCVHTGTGTIYVWQNPPSGSNYGGFVFVQSAGEWARINSVTNDWHRNFEGLYENYDMCYDADRDRFLRSCGAPFPGPGDSVGSSRPHWGDSEYHVDSDEWYTPYPKTGCTYSPTPADSGYFGTPGNSLEGFTPCYRYYDGAIYQFGGYNVDSRQALKKRVVATGVITTEVAWASCPAWTTPTARYAPARSGFDATRKKLWTFADGWELYECDLRLSTLSWAHVPTTGQVPSVPVPSYRAGQGITATDYGIHAVVDEKSNCIVAWCGQNSDVTGIGETDIRQTWILDLATRAWRYGPGNAFGDYVPRGQDGVTQNLFYDPVSKRTLLIQAYNGFCEVYALQVAPVGGIITSWPLPTSSGSTYGVSYYGFPFTSNGSSKQSYMAYCPQDGRIYAQGGDTIHSATDGTWSVDPNVGNDWRLDVGEADYGVTVCPHGLQDGFGMAWVASQGKFVLWPGSSSAYYPYPAPIDPGTYPDQNYSFGYWWYDPLTATYTQDTRLWSTYYSGTGCETGGAWDEDNEYIVVAQDNTFGTSKVIRRYDPVNGAQISPDISLTYTNSPTLPAAYYTSTKPAVIGRWVYFIGYRTNGTTASQAPMFFRWHMDNHTTEELTAPPVDATIMQLKLVYTGVSNGKVVFPYITGADGALVGLYVYNPANDTWTTETKRPAYGNFIYNSICSLPDGRVAMSGGVFGSQQTHMWFYEAT